MNHQRTASVGRWGAWLGMAAALALSVGCGLDEVKMPPLSGSGAGPATYGTGVRISVTPDVIFADGQSTATVTVTVFGPDGKPLAGRDVYLYVADDQQRIIALGTLSAQRLVTDSQGQVRAVYTAPPAVEYSSNGTISLKARVTDSTTENGTGDNANVYLWPYVKLQLLAVEQRHWPEWATGTATCHFMVEPRWGPWYVGVPYRFETRSNATPYVQTYIWRFSDNMSKYYYSPDVYHTFTEPGDYIVFHSVLSAEGSVDSCNLGLKIEAAP